MAIETRRGGAGRVWAEAPRTTIMLDGQIVAWSSTLRGVAVYAQRNPVTQVRIEGLGDGRASVCFTFADTATCDIPTANIAAFQNWLGHRKSWGEPTVRGHGCPDGEFLLILSFQKGVTP